MLHKTLPQFNCSACKYICMVYLHKYMHIALQPVINHALTNVTNECQSYIWMRAECWQMIDQWAGSSEHEIVVVTLLSFVVNSVAVQHIVYSYTIFELHASVVCTINIIILIGYKPFVVVVTLRICSFKFEVIFYFSSGFLLDVAIYPDIGKYWQLIVLMSIRALVIVHI